MRHSPKTTRIPISPAARSCPYGRRRDTGAGPHTGMKTPSGVILTLRYEEDSNDCWEGA
jgi:hypothetical protein